MATILFFEKPGCQNNTRQKALLEDSGHQVEAVNLLEHSWSKEELARYLGEKPVAEWFNMAAPKVKSGEVNPHLYSREEAIALMIREPLLIKRPLMKIGNHYFQGFDIAGLKKLINLVEQEKQSENLSDMNSCPHNNNYSCTIKK
ncbi:arsenate reductase family protein [Chlorobium sp. KB01]|uniref:arsenate reductase family protein n=1 Tax=Chlorobium sp. KB01 TaxID=1917528 RepID=UPI0009757593|nr:arsenate reductase family protein [Chlorobium sp. KB01]